MPFGVNQVMLRRSIAELIDAGPLGRRHARGVLVFDSQVGGSTRFTESLVAFGTFIFKRLISSEEPLGNKSVVKQL